MTKRQIKIGGPCLVIALAAFVTFTGCNSTPQSSSAAPSTQPAQATRGRAEIWSQTCNRCHNAWSPDQLSAHQWDAVAQHMRLRAGLTREEHDAVLEFLQASR